jgi:hypothetical protein
MITEKQLSRYRQSIRKLVERIDWLASRCLFKDPLIHGSPAEVYRRCGRKGCACATDDSRRHGPYKVIQVVGQNQSRQVCLRREQEHLWQLAQHYQHQVKRLTELKQACRDLQDMVREVINLRIVEFPSDE